MNPGLRAGTLELISSRSSLKHVTDSDENCDQHASDHRDLSKIYQGLNPTNNLLVALKLLDIKFILKILAGISLFS